MQVYQAGNLTIQSIVAMLGIDYDDDDKAYGWALNPYEIEQSKDADLSPWARKSFSKLRRCHLHDQEIPILYSISPRISHSYYR